MIFLKFFYQLDPETGGIKEDANQMGEDLGLDPKRMKLLEQSMLNVQNFSSKAAQLKTQSDQRKMQFALDKAQQEIMAKPSMIDVALTSKNYGEFLSVASANGYNYDIEELTDADAQKLQMIKKNNPEAYKKLIYHLDNLKSQKKNPSYFSIQNYEKTQSYLQSFYENGITSDDTQRHFTNLYYQNNQLSKSNPNYKAARAMYDSGYRVQVMKDSKVAEPLVNRFVEEYKPYWDNVAVTSAGMQEMEDRHKILARNLDKYYEYKGGQLEEISLVGKTKEERENIIKNADDSYIKRMESLNDKLDDYNEASNELKEGNISGEEFKNRAKVFYEAMRAEGLDPESKDDKEKVLRYSNMPGFMHQGKSDLTQISYYEEKGKNMAIANHYMAFAMGLPGANPSLGNAIYVDPETKEPKVVLYSSIDFAQKYKEKIKEAEKLNGKNDLTENQLNMLAADAVFQTRNLGEDFQEYNEQKGFLKTSKDAITNYFTGKFIPTLGVGGTMIGRGIGYYGKNDEGILELNRAIAVSSYEKEKQPLSKVQENSNDIWSSEGLGNLIGDTTAQMITTGGIGLGWNLGKGGINVLLSKAGWNTFTNTVGTNLAKSQAINSLSGMGLNYAKKFVGNFATPTMIWNSSYAGSEAYTEARKMGLSKDVAQDLFYINAAAVGLTEGLLGDFGSKLANDITGLGALKKRMLYEESKKFIQENSKNLVKELGEKLAKGETAEAVKETAKQNFLTKTVKFFQDMDDKMANPKNVLGYAANAGWNTAREGFQETLEESINFGGEMYVEDKYSLPVWTFDNSDFSGRMIDTFLATMVSMAPISVGGAGLRFGATKLFDSSKQTDLENESKQNLSSFLAYHVSQNNKQELVNVVNDFRKQGAYGSQTVDIEGNVITPGSSMKSKNDFIADLTLQKIDQIEKDVKAYGLKNVLQYINKEENKDLYNNVFQDIVNQKQSISDYKIDLYNEINSRANLFENKKVVESHKYSGRDFVFENGDFVPFDAEKHVKMEDFAFKVNTISDKYFTFQEELNKKEGQKQNLANNIENAQNEIEVLKSQLNENEKLKASELQNIQSRSEEQVDVTDVLQPSKEEQMMNLNQKYESNLVSTQNKIQKLESDIQKYSNELNLLENQQNGELDEETKNIANIADELDFYRKMYARNTDYHMLAQDYKDKKIDEKTFLENGQILEENENAIAQKFANTPYGSKIKRLVEAENINQTPESLRFASEKYKANFLGYYDPKASQAISDLKKAYYYAFKEKAMYKAGLDNSKLAIMENLQNPNLKIDDFSNQLNEFSVLPYTFTQEEKRIIAEALENQKINFRNQINEMLQIPFEALSEDDIFGTIKIQNNEKELILYVDNQLYHVEAKEFLNPIALKEKWINLYEQEHIVKDSFKNTLTDNIEDQNVAKTILDLDKFLTEDSGLTSLQNADKKVKELLERDIENTQPKSPLLSSSFTVAFETINDLYNKMTNGDENQKRDALLTDISSPKTVFVTTAKILEIADALDFDFIFDQELQDTLEKGLDMLNYIESNKEDVDTLRVKEEIDVLLTKMRELGMDMPLNVNQNIQTLHDLYAQYIAYYDQENPDNAFKFGDFIGHLKTLITDSTEIHPTVEQQIALYNAVKDTIYGKDTNSIIKAFGGAGKSTITNLYIDLVSKLVPNVVFLVGTSFELGVNTLKNATKNNKSNIRYFTFNNEKNTFQIEGKNSLIEIDAKKSLYKELGVDPVKNQFVLIIDEIQTVYQKSIPDILRNGEDKIPTLLLGDYTQQRENGFFEKDSTIYSSHFFNRKEQKQFILPQTLSISFRAGYIQIADLVKGMYHLTKQTIREQNLNNFYYKNNTKFFNNRETKLGIEVSASETAVVNSFIESINSGKNAILVSYGSNVLKDLKAKYPNQVFDNELVNGIQADEVYVLFKGDSTLSSNVLNTYLGRAKKYINVFALNTNKPIFSGKNEQVQNPNEIISYEKTDPETVKERIIQRNEIFARTFNQYNARNQKPDIKTPEVQEAEEINAEQTPVEDLNETRSQEFLEAPSGTLELLDKNFGVENDVFSVPLSSIKQDFDQQINDIKNLEVNLEKKSSEKLSSKIESLYDLFFANPSVEAYEELNSLIKDAINQYFSEKLDAQIQEIEKDKILDISSPNQIEKINTVFDADGYNFNKNLYLENRKKFFDAIHNKNSLKDIQAKVKGSEIFLGYNISDEKDSIDFMYYGSIPNTTKIKDGIYNAEDYIDFNYSKKANADRYFYKQYAGEKDGQPLSLSDFEKDMAKLGYFITQPFVNFRALNSKISGKDGELTGIAFVVVAKSLPERIAIEKAFLQNNAEEILSFVTKNTVQFVSAKNVGSTDFTVDQMIMDFDKYIDGKVEGFNILDFFENPVSVKNLAAISENIEETTARNGMRKNFLQDNNTLLYSFFNLAGIYAPQERFTVLNGLEKFTNELLSQISIKTNDANISNIQSIFNKIVKEITEENNQATKKEFKTHYNEAIPIVYYALKKAQSLKIDINNLNPQLNIPTNLFIEKKERFLGKNLLAAPLGEWKGTSFGQNLIVRKKVSSEQDIWASKDNKIEFKQKKEETINKKSTTSKKIDKSDDFEKRTNSLDVQLVDTSEIAQILSSYFGASLNLNFQELEEIYNSGVFRDGVLVGKVANGIMTIFQKDGKASIKTANHESVHYLKYFMPYQKWQNILDSVETAIEEKLIIPKKGNNENVSRETFLEETLAEWFEDNVNQIKKDKLSTWFNNSYKKLVQIPLISNLFAGLYKLYQKIKSVFNPYLKKDFGRVLDDLQSGVFYNASFENNLPVYPEDESRKNSELHDLLEKNFQILKNKYNEVTGDYASFDRVFKIQESNWIKNKYGFRGLNKIDDFIIGRAQSNAGYRRNFSKVFDNLEGWDNTTYSESEGIEYLKDQIVAHAFLTFGMDYKLFNKAMQNATVYKTVMDYLKNYGGGSIDENEFSRLTDEEFEIYEDLQEEEIDKVTNWAESKMGEQEATMSKELRRIFNSFSVYNANIQLEKIPQENKAQYFLENSQKIESQLLAFYPDKIAVLESELIALFERIFENQDTDENNNPIGFDSQSLYEKLKLAIEERMEFVNSKKKLSVLATLHHNLYNEQEFITSNLYDFEIAEDKTPEELFWYPQIIEQYINSIFTYFLSNRRRNAISFEYVQKNLGTQNVNKFYVQQSFYNMFSQNNKEDLLSQFDRGLIKAAFDVEELDKSNNKGIVDNIQTAISKKQNSNLSFLGNVKQITANNKKYLYHLLKNESDKIVGFGYGSFGNGILSDYNIVSLDDSFSTVPESAISSYISKGFSGNKDNQKQLEINHLKNLYNAFVQQTGIFEDFDDFFMQYYPVMKNLPFLNTSALNLEYLNQTQEKISPDKINAALDFQQKQTFNTYFVTPNLKNINKTVLNAEGNNRATVFLTGLNVQIDDVLNTNPVSNHFGLDNPRFVLDLGSFYEKDVKQSVSEGNIIGKNSLSEKPSLLISLSFENKFGTDPKMFENLSFYEYWTLAAQGFLNIVHSDKSTTFAYANNLQNKPVLSEEESIARIQNIQNYFLDNLASTYKKIFGVEPVFNSPIEVQNAIDEIEYRYATFMNKSELLEAHPNLKSGIDFYPAKKNGGIQFAVNPRLKEIAILEPEQFVYYFKQAAENDFNDFNNRQTVNKPTIDLSEFELSMIENFENSIKYQGNPLQYKNLTDKIKRAIILSTNHTIGVSSEYGLPQVLNTITVDDAILERYYDVNLTEGNYMSSDDKNGGNYSQMFHLLSLSGIDVKSLETKIFDGIDFGSQVIRMKQNHSFGMDLYNFSQFKPVVANKDFQDGGNALFNKMSVTYIGEEHLNYASNELMNYYRLTMGDTLIQKRAEIINNKKLEISAKYTKYIENKSFPKEIKEKLNKLFNENPEYNSKEKAFDAVLNMVHLELIEFLESKEFLDEMYKQAVGVQDFAHTISYPSSIKVGHFNQVPRRVMTDMGVSFSMLTPNAISYPLQSFGQVSNLDQPVGNTSVPEPSQFNYIKGQIGDNFEKAKRSFDKKVSLAEENIAFLKTKISDEDKNIEKDKIYRELVSRTSGDDKRLFNANVHPSHPLMFEIFNRNVTKYINDYSPTKFRGTRANVTPATSLYQIYEVEKYNEETGKYEYLILNTKDLLRLGYAQSNGQDIISIGNSNSTIIKRDLKPQRIIKVEENGKRIYPSDLVLKQFVALNEAYTKANIYDLETIKQSFDDFIQKERLVVLPGEILLPNYYSQDLKSGNKTLKEILEETPEHKTFFETLGARIPLTGLNSVAPFEVVGFINSNANTVFVPSEYFTTTGGDADGDTLTFLFKDFARNKSSEIRNSILESNRSMFLDAKNVISSMMPIEHEAVIQKANEASLNYQNSSISEDKSVPALIREITPKAIASKGYANIASKSLIGIGVSATQQYLYFNIAKKNLEKTLLSLGKTPQEIKTQTNKAFGLHNFFKVNKNGKYIQRFPQGEIILQFRGNNYPVNSFGLDFTNDGRLAVKQFESSNNIALDAAKLDIDKINLNKYTMPAITAGIALGIDIDSIYQVITHPSVINYIQDIETQLSFGWKNVEGIKKLNANYSNNIEFKDEKDFFSFLYNIGNGSIEGKGLFYLNSEEKSNLKKGLKQNLLLQKLFEKPTLSNMFESVIEDINAIKTSIANGDPKFSENGYVNLMASLPHFEAQFKILQYSHDLKKSHLFHASDESLDIINKIFDGISLFNDMSYLKASRGLKEFLEYEYYLSLKNTLNSQINNNKRNEDFYLHYVQGVQSKESVIKNKFIGLFKKAQNEYIQSLIETGSNKVTTVRSMFNQIKEVDAPTGSYLSYGLSIDKKEENATNKQYFSQFLDYANKNYPYFSSALEAFMILSSGIESSKYSIGGILPESFHQNFSEFLSNFDTKFIDKNSIAQTIQLGKLILPKESQYLKPGENFALKYDEDFGKITFALIQNNQNDKFAKEIYHPFPGRTNIFSVKNQLYPKRKPILILDENRNIVNELEIKSYLMVAPRLQDLTFNPETESVIFRTTKNDYIAVSNKEGSLIFKSCE